MGCTGGLRESVAASELGLASRIEALAEKFFALYCYAEGRFLRKVVSRQDRLTEQRAELASTVGEEDED
jgi:hypothetical protein